MMKFFNYFPLDWEGSNLMNINENNEAYIINFRAVGLSKEDIEIGIEGNVLSISTKTSKNETKWIQQEFWNDRINKKIEFPSDVDVDGVSAEVEKGILKIRLPKAKTSTKRRSIRVD